MKATIQHPWDLQLELQIPSGCVRTDTVRCCWGMKDNWVVAFGGNIFAFLHSPAHLSRILHLKFFQVGIVLGDSFRNCEFLRTPISHVFWQNWIALGTSTFQSHFIQIQLQESYLFLPIRGCGIVRHTPLRRAGAPCTSRFPCSPTGWRHDGSCHSHHQRWRHRPSLCVMVNSPSPIRVYQHPTSDMSYQPNLIPPITTVEAALSYKSRLEALAPLVTFLVSLYLHPSITPSTIKAAKVAGITGVKSYPAGVTTNSAARVVDYESFYPVFAAMEAEDLLLNLHGESPPGEDITVLNAEERFLPTLLDLHRRFPK
jgi:hypothetical protein